MGALPTDQALSPDQVARRVLRPLRDLGLEPPVGGAHRDHAGLRTGLSVA